jgi:hypothetical protein
MSLEPEHEHAHGHKTGVPWLDIIFALSAVFISVVSLVVSMAHGKTMERLVQQNERMVAADTLPFLMFYSSSADPQTFRKRVSVELKNGGVGPAVIDWLEIRWRGHAYDTPEALIQACCAQPDTPGKPHVSSGIGYSNISGTVLPARETAKLLVDFDIKDPAVADAFSKARFELTARACYCSVLDECWITDFQQSRPKAVKDCKAPADMKRW